MSGESSNISCPQNVRILVTDSTPEFFNFLDYHATLYQEQNPNIRISIDSVADLEDQLLQSKDWDASIFPAQLIGSLAEKEILWDLSHFIETSATLDWTEMLPFFRNPSAVYGSSSEALDEDEDGDGEAPRAIPRVIPLDGDLLSMYYRRDLFQQYNLTIPRTWEEYNQAAAFFDGMPLGPGGSPLFGSCVSRIDRCSNDYWASLILASMTQVLGTSSGFFLDPSTLSPLFGRAMEETLRIIREQFTSGHEDELTGECLASNFAFNEGNCALTYNWGNQIIVEGSALFDVGVAPTPGSQVVLDRSSRQLVECTPELCPHGVYYTDIGLVNHAPYAAFGGWVSGVADQAPEGQKYAVADFLAYVSNSQQSLGDVLPNSRSSFSQPYRYSHATSSNWIDAGFGRSLASDYTEAVRSINSENSALELRVPSAARMRNIVDQEVFEYLLETVNPGLTTEIDLRLRQESTARMEGQINDIVATLDLSDSYRRSIGYTYTPEADSQNLINEDFRDAAWGLSGLMCVVCVSLMIWTFRHRNNRVMRAFQPFLLFQSTVGLLLMSSSIIPLGFDDSWYDVDVLNITCMLSPWLYVVGFTIFFSAVYAKIRECIKIYRDPQSYSILLVDPKSCLRLCMRLLTLNGILLGLWTGLDPLRWERQEVEGGIVLEDGTVETYGTCTGGSAALVFAVLLYVLNMLIALIATLQAFKCRFLVLEYNEMQWLPLSVFPFFEVWLIGGPILPLILEDPTVVFVVISSMIFVSTVAGGMAVFAPKDWYIRKYYHSNPKGFPERTSSAGIMVLQHPTVECNKQIESLSFKVEQIEGWNTELEIEIRLMKEKFKDLTTSEKLNIRESIITEALADADSGAYRGSRGMEEYEQAGITKSNDDDLAAMEQFQQVWKMPDEEEEDENHMNPVKQASFHSLHSLASSLGSLGNDDEAVGTSNRSGLGLGLESAPEHKKSEEKPTTLRRIAPQPPESSSQKPPEPPSDPLAIIALMDDSEDEYEPQDANDPLARLAMADDDDDPYESQDPDDPLVRLMVGGDDDDDDDDDDYDDYEPDDPDDPLARLGMMDDDSEEDDGPQEPSSRPATIGNVGPQDQLPKSDEKLEESAQDIVKRIIAMRLASVDGGEGIDGHNSAGSATGDPLERLMAMGGDDESEQSELYRKQAKAAISDNGEADIPDKELLARIIAMRLAAADEEDGSGVNIAKTNPEDPLERIMNMNAEDQLISAAMLMRFLDPQDEEDEDDDVIIRKKDFRDLSSMIQDNELEELERRAVTLAESVKTKLEESTLADLTRDAETTLDSDTGMGYLALAKGGHKDAVNTSHAINGLDISKISNDDDGDRRFVSMSDSILDSPGRANNKSELLGPESSEDSKHSGGVRASAGESSTDTKQRKGLSAAAAAALDQGDGRNTQSQFAGEPSQGESGRFALGFKGIGRKETINDAAFRSPKTPSKRQLNDSPVKNKSYEISDWAAVGGLANVLAEWSDSQSSTSYGGSSAYAESSAQDSVTSFEATTRASLLDTPVANELDQLVGKMDWDGVKAAAEKYETSADAGLPATSTSTSMSFQADVSGMSALDEKRKKKRELEAWRDSLAKSFTK